MTRPLSPDRVTCRRLVTGVAAFAVAATPFTMAVPAHAAGANTINVYVSDYYGGQPLASMSVSLLNTLTGATVGSAQVSDANGKAEFTGLDDGAYTAKVAGTTKYDEKFSTATTVDADNTTSSASVSPVPKTAQVGKIKGTVSKAGSHVHGYAEIFPSTATEAAVLSGAVMPISSARGYFNDGQYGVDTSTVKWKSGNLAPGTYKVLLGDEHSDSSSYIYNSDHTQSWRHYSTSVWVGAGTGANNTADNAATLTVSAEGLTAAPAATLIAPATPVGPTRVTGTVTGTGAAKLSGVSVTLFQNVGGSWYSRGYEYTDDKGAFVFNQTLAAGTYTLRANDGWNDYKAEFLGDIHPDYPWSLPSPDVTTFALGADGAVTQNMTLDRSPVDRSSGIFGTVTDDRNIAHPGAVTVFDVYGNYVASTYTHRDGGWEILASSLAPGTYKVRAESEQGDAVSAFQGASSFNGATKFTVPVKGAINVGGSQLKRYGYISTKITLPASTRAADSSVTGTLTTLNGNRAGYTYGESGDTLTMRVAPGTYLLQATGYRWNPFNQSNNYDPNAVTFIPQFWKTGFSADTATKIKVASGAKVSGLNFTLGRTLKATSAPAISGTAKAGAVLRGAVGAWNVADDVAFTYTWKRGTSVVSRAAMYKVATADVGKTLTLTIGARDTNGEFLPGTATSKQFAIPKPVKKKKKSKKKKK
ncbi:carboxypeptidase-like regulatory domain-containing protein [Nocardioides sp.]|uniref:carboxypeptidase-like regulatory domain-containing protein n=1 Tax=Nocardioides sp. TaxID=35761 RepID=UPI002624641C|nr:carboxypeptidase-like regulatory domain-containing protein [Nocardioides sp.]